MFIISKIEAGRQGIKHRTAFLVAIVAAEVSATTNATAINEQFVLSAKDFPTLQEAQQVEAEKKKNLRSERQPLELRLALQRRKEEMAAIDCQIEYNIAEYNRRNPPYGGCSLQ